jgi:hypothetical protein
MTGGYPARAELAEWAGVTAPVAAGAVPSPGGATMLGLTAAAPCAGTCCSSSTSSQTDGCCSDSGSTNSETAGCC